MKIYLKCLTLMYLDCLNAQSTYFFLDYFRYGHLVPLISVFLLIVIIDSIGIVGSIYLLQLRSFSLFFTFTCNSVSRLLRLGVFEQFFQSPHATLRKLSLSSVNQYIMLMPTVSNKYVIYFVNTYFGPCSGLCIDSGSYNMYDCRRFTYPWTSIFKVYLFLQMTLRQKCESWLVLYSKCI